MANGGVNLYAISLQNEPDAVVDYEFLAADHGLIRDLAAGKLL